MPTRFTWLRAAGAATLLAAGLALGGCGDAFPDYHYKMTIYAGGKAFSSVRGIEQERVSSLADSSGSRVKTTLSGEAVIMDLNGRTYYALLSKPDRPEYAAGVAGLALRPHVPGEKPLGEVDRAIEEYNESQQGRSPTAYLDDQASANQAMVEVAGPKDLPRTEPNTDPYRGPRSFDSWPMFVTFSDPRDPKSVREVSPESIGVSRITIEITNEDVTTGIEERLAWLVKFKTSSSRLSGNRSIVVSNTDRSLAENLGIGAFLIKKKK